MGESGLSWVEHGGAPGRLGRLLHGIYEACSRGMEENGGSAEGT